MHAIELHIVFVGTFIEIVHRCNPGEVVIWNSHITNFSDLVNVATHPISSLTHRITHCMLMRQNMGIEILSLDLTILIANLKTEHTKDRT